MAVLAAKLTQLRGGARSRLSDCLLLFRPDTVLGWHRALVRHKWTFALLPQRGQPRTDPAVVTLILAPSPVPAPPPAGCTHLAPTGKVWAKDKAAWCRAPMCPKRSA
ncbi:MAG TPA: hypothetical protein VNL71_21235 [Chloroflexota bacterium]|nr:hypothetical protein [Chloroflexota bacterium]